MKKILLDTNFLLIPLQFKIDIFSEIDRIMLEKYKLYTLDKIIDELKSIQENPEQSRKNKKAAKLALQLMKAKKIDILKTKKDKPADNIIADLKDYIIATQDIALKRRLKAKKIRIITLRAKKKLIML
jgi:hypothetical protein